MVANAGSMPPSSAHPHRTIRVKMVFIKKDGTLRAASGDIDTESRSRILMSSACPIGGVGRGKKYQDRDQDQDQEHCRSHVLRRSTRLKSSTVDGTGKRKSKIKSNIENEDTAITTSTIRYFDLGIMAFRSFDTSRLRRIEFVDGARVDE